MAQKPSANLTSSNRNKLIQQLVKLMQRKEELRQKLQKLSEQIAYMGAVSDSLSAANRLLHAKGVVVKLELDEDIYKIHNSTEP